MFVVVTEDVLSEAVAGKLVCEGGFDSSEIRFSGRRGFGYLKSNVRKYMEAARQCPVLMLTDLDARQCAPNLVGDWTGDVAAPKDFLLRVAVRETEAWLMADRDGFAEYLGVSKAKLPRDVEGLPDPKRYLLEVARGAKKKIREGLLPLTNAAASQGFGYNPLLSKFVTERWSSAKAAANCESLKRTIARLEAVKIRSSDR